METTITVISDLALTLSFIVAVVFGILQVRSSERDRRERLALDFLSNFQSREFAELLHYLSRQSIPDNVHDLRALPENEQIMFIQLSQQMESLGLLVAVKLISIELIDRTLGSYVTLAWKKYEILYKVIRESDPYQGEYFQWLAEELERTQRDAPRKPFYLLGKVAT